MARSIATCERTNRAGRRCIQNVAEGEVRPHLRTDSFQERSERLGDERCWRNPRSTLLSYWTKPLTAATSKPCSAFTKPKLSLLLSPARRRAVWTLCERST